MGSQGDQQEEVRGVYRALAGPSRTSHSAESPTVLQPGDEEMLALEVEVLRQLSHPNIIHLYKCVLNGRLCHARGHQHYTTDLSQLTAVHAECLIPNTRCSWCWSL